MLDTVSSLYLTRGGSKGWPGGAPGTAPCESCPLVPPQMKLFAR